MTRRFSLFFALVLIILTSIYLYSSRTAACGDPTGCIRIASGGPVVFGLGLITSGVESALSNELKRSADLVSLNYQSSNHPFIAHPYYSACLPNLPDQSAVDLSADKQIVAVLGPFCAEDNAAYTQRMRAADKVVISPVAYLSGSGDDEISFHPDISLLASQGARWLQRLGFSKIAVAHDPDEPSAAFSARLCEMIQTFGACLENTDRVSEPPNSQSDAAVLVLLNDAIPLQTNLENRASSFPQILVSFSRPQSDPAQIQPQYWIGPRFWADNQGFTSRYTDLYESTPYSLASGIIYLSLPLVYDVVKENAVAAWDGSWIVPISVVNQRLAEKFSTENLFCDDATRDCPVLPFVLYQKTGNEYKILNP